MQNARSPSKASTKRLPEGHAAWASSLDGWWPWQNGVSAVLLIVVVGLAAYSNSFSAAFVYDGTMLRDSTMLHSFPNAVRASMRPVAMLSFYANYQVHGYKLLGYHIVNLAIHLLAAVVLMEVVRRTLRRGRLAESFAEHSLPLALTVALLWMVHPLQTQSVTYIYQRFESLMGLFFLTSVYCFVRAVDARRPWGWYATSIAYWLLALGSKEVAFVAPAVVLWYDRALVSSSWRELLKRRWAYYASLMGIAVAGAAVIWVRRTWYAGAGVLSFDHVSPLEYARSQPGVILHYLRLAFLPEGQCIDYRWPIASTTTAILGPLVPLVALLGLTTWCVWRRPAWGFLGGWFFLTLAPTSSIAPIIDLAYEHRVYLALAAVVAAVVFAVYGCLMRSRWFSTMSNSSQRNVCIGLVAAVTIALGSATFERNKVYQDELTLWGDTVAKAPWNDRALYNLGCQLLDIGDYPGAIACYQNAIQKAPNDHTVRASLAGALGSVGRFQEAAELCRTILREEPRNAEALVNLASALGGLGQQAEALQYCRTAVKVWPRNAKAHATLATLLAGSDPQEALKQMSEAHRLDPDSPTINLGMGNLLARTDPKAAIPYYEAAIARNPGFAEAHFNVANAWVACGQPGKAVPHLEEAIRLRPDWPEARNNLRILRQHLGRQ